MKGILGRKKGMTEVFTTDGKLIPVTVIEVEDNVVSQIKTKETDGYDAIQLATVDKKESRSNKPEIGHLKKANATPKRFLKEIRGASVSEYALGDVLKADTFAAGEMVDVTGTSKGKGFQGVIKRIKMANEKDRFDGDVSLHYHGKCIKCNSVIDIFLKENIDLSIDEHVKNETNINVVSHDIIFNVICPNCDK